MTTLNASHNVPVERRLPGVKEVRENFHVSRRSRSTFMGVVIFAIPTLLYLASFLGMIFFTPWWAKIACAAGVTFFIPVLFIIGHDACHGSLTPRAWLNRLIGRITFLPALHVFSVWEYGHNGLHHGWTNLRGKDLVWAPFSKQDYDRLPAFRRWVERVYRSPIGVGVYYIVEMWARFGMTCWQGWGRNRIVPKFYLARFGVACFAVAQVWALILFSRFAESNPLSQWWSSIVIVAVGVVLPFLLWNWFMGFTVFLHHTHERVAWYDNETEWSYYAGQVRGVVHVRFPRLMELILHNIMDHTAHHVDPRIPLYNLTAAQTDLERAYAEDVVVAPWTLRQFLRTLRVCQLYDYENHQWLDFAGNPTSGRTV